MKYVHTALYKVKGLTLAPGQDERELVIDANRNLRAFIARQPDEHCLDGDRAGVVASMMLNGLFGAARVGSFEEALASELEKLRERRKADLRGSSALVIEVTGDVEDFLTPPHREQEGFVISFEGPPKELIRQR